MEELKEWRVAWGFRPGAELSESAITAQAQGFNYMVFNDYIYPLPLVEGGPGAFRTIGVVREYALRYPDDQTIEGRDI